MAHPRARRADLLGRTGRACYRHRWLTLAAWLVGVTCLIMLWVNYGAPADNNFSGSDPGQALLNAHFHRQSGDTLTLAISSASPVTSPQVARRVTGALATFRKAPGVSVVTSPYQVPGHISPDRHIAFATIQFGVSSAGISNSETLALMNDARAASGHGLALSLGGDVVDLAETPFGGPTEGIGTAAAAIVLLIAFGSLLAMGLPVVTALFGIGSGLSLIGLLGHVFPAPSFSPIVASLIGLGVGVDYALFIVTRFREALRGQPAGGPAGGPARPAQAPQEALVTTMRTAGGSVLTAGSTVAIGALGLLVLRQPLLSGVAIAAAATVAMTVLAALTLLPALLGFTGTRLARPSRLRLAGLRLAGLRYLRRRPARRTSGQQPGPVRQADADGRQAIRFVSDLYSAGSQAASLHPAQRWAAVIQRRPVLATVASAVAILALAAPALGMKLNFPDESAQARNTMGYASYATMARGFGPGYDAPLIIAAKLPPGGASVARLAAAVRATPGVASVTPPVTSPDGQATMMIAYPDSGEQDPATNTLVNHLTGDVLPRATAGTGIRAYLTGPNAANVAFANITGQRLPLLIAIVVALSMLLLLVVFRSVVIAIKAAAMNLLSIGAAYGVLVMICQHGWGRWLFGFGETMPVTTWVPVFLFVILFGLSMDYEVFLLSRIREAYQATGDNAGSVASGLASTARVISAAAAIMVVVFGAVVLGDNVQVKQVGLGLAVAVLIDATLVRLVLVPGVMELLGRANWWLPRPLARILPGGQAGPALDPGLEPGPAVPAPAGPDPLPVTGTGPDRYCRSREDTDGATRRDVRT
jgi:RND superfamily putative drug exporter